MIDIILIVETVEKVGLFEKIVKTFEIDWIGEINDIVEIRSQKLCCNTH